ncbi:MAG: DUF72 domain-containing protein [Desulfurococcaceae archaeon]
MKTVFVGCCGFPCARRKYYGLFSVVELQNTFYELPSVDWALSLRGEAPENFVFTVKAWQVITHPSTSPTWKRMKRKPDGDPSNYGYLKPTRENIKAFEKTVEVAKALNASVIVLQTPSSMPYNEETVLQVKRFFEEVSTYTGGNIVVGWEPRGAWASAKELKGILEMYDVMHVVDVFRSRPLYLHSRRILYTRLHGIGPGEVNYSYYYTDEDLNKLTELLNVENYDAAFVMFNNVKMLDNGLRFKEILREKKNFNVR